MGIGDVRVLFFPFSLTSLIGSLASGKRGYIVWGTARMATIYLIISMSIMRSWDTYL
jgi:hypothetical protein